MQTKQQIQALLAEGATGPKRRLGQHFLIDLNLMRRLVDQADIGPNDVVLEVGCGTGSLTEALAERAAAVIAVDVDETVIELARRQLAGRPHVTLLHCDILQSKHRLQPAVTETLAAARARSGGRFLLVANLPYHVASPLMLNLVQAERPVDAMVVTVQKEVAQRMAADPGSGHYGILSVLLQVTGSVQLLRVLKPSVFWPPPQVDSAMVAYRRDPERAAAIANPSLLRTLLEAFLGHRRKMLQRCVRLLPPELADCDWDTLLPAAELHPAWRPDQVDPAGYVRLANALAATRP